MGYSLTARSALMDLAWVSRAFKTIQSRTQNMRRGSLDQLSQAHHVICKVFSSLIQMLVFFSERILRKIRTATYLSTLEGARHSFTRTWTASKP